MRRGIVLTLLALIVVGQARGGGPMRNPGLDDFVRLDQITEVAQYWRPERISGMAEFYASNGAQAVTAPQPFNATLANEVYGVSPGQDYRLSVNVLLEGGVARVGLDDAYSEWITTTVGWDTLTVTGTAKIAKLDAILQASGNGARVYFDNARLSTYESKTIDGLSSCGEFCSFLPDVY